MEKLTEEIEQKLNHVGAQLSNLESISRVIQVCFEDGDNLKDWDIETIFEILKYKINEIKNNFSELIETLKI